MGLGLWRERRQRQETKLGPGLPRPHQAGAEAEGTLMSTWRALHPQCEMSTAWPRPPRGCRLPPPVSGTPRPWRPEKPHLTAECPVGRWSAPLHGAEGSLGHRPGSRCAGPWAWHRQGCGGRLMPGELGRHPVCGDTGPAQMPPAATTTCSASSAGLLRGRFSGSQCPPQPLESSLSPPLLLGASPWQP